MLATKANDIEFYPLDPLDRTSFYMLSSDLYKQAGICAHTCMYTNTHIHIANKVIVIQTEDIML